MFNIFPDYLIIEIFRFLSVREIILYCIISNDFSFLVEYFSSKTIDQKWWKNCAAIEMQYWRNKLAVSDRNRKNSMHDENEICVADIPICNKVINDVKINSFIKIVMNNLCIFGEGENCCKMKLPERPISRIRANTMENIRLL